MWRPIASWRDRRAARAVEKAPAAPDREALAQAGVALRRCYTHEDEELDDRLVGLMLELSVDPPAQGRVPGRPTQKPPGHF
jgi:hypothetical protein